MPTQYYNHVSHDLLTITTRVVVKFCREHKSDVTLFEDVLGYLEANDFEAAIALLRDHPPGPFRWNDWSPAAASEHEDAEYVLVVWESLVERWYRLMRTASGVKD